MQEADSILPCLLAMSSHRTPSQTTRSKRSLERELFDAVQRELLLTNDHEEAVRRATLRVFNKKQSGGVSPAGAGFDINHPLAQLFDAPAPGKRPTNTRHDIKRHLTRQDASLFQKALPFAPQLWQQALGNEMSLWVKPLGYADRHEQVVLIEVDSAARAHDLSFYKAELLYRIRTIEGLEHVRDFRFRVNAQAEVLPDFSSLLKTSRR